MADRILDPNKFLLLGAVTDWLAVSRRHLGRRPPAREIAAQRKLDLTRLVQLRWLLAPELGYPTEPFRVWRRPAMPHQTEKTVPFSRLDLFGAHLYVTDRPRVFLRAGVQVTATSGSVMAFSGVPFFSPIVATRPLVTGFNSVTLSGPTVQSLLVSGGDLVALTGLDHAATDDPQWQLVEMVGLPVTPSWNGLFDLGRPQGLVSALGDPGDAALDRFRRGAPFYGWEEPISPAMAAPPWTPADANAMLAAIRQDMLEPLRKMVVSRPPAQHASFTVNHDLMLEGVGEPAKTKFNPLPALLFGAATDPLVSLMSGFGTAFEDLDLPPTVLQDRELFNDPTRSDWDFMVTARYAKGPNGNSAPVEYAAIVFAPPVSSAPPAPASLEAGSDGLGSPTTTDADWRAIVRVGWDKLSDTLPFRVGSYAFARAAQSPLGATTPLMNARRFDTALQPISATTNPEQGKLGRLQAMDDGYGLSSFANPNALLYALAHQDLFGLWSAWATVPLGIAEPSVQALSIVSTRLDVTPPAVAGGTCPATLVAELSWDWATRSPERFDLVGRLFAQTQLGETPGDTTVPVGMQAASGGPAGVPLVVSFAGGAGGVVSTGNPALVGTIEYLSLDGKTFAASPPSLRGPRRYRLTVTGFALDFSSVGRLGLALWGRGIEHRAPQRTGAYGGRPTVASAADPRPPVLSVEHEDVLMASLGDSAGEHHALLEWPAAPGASGYFVYTCAENKLRLDRGLPEAARSLTLSERLGELRDAFAADPQRRSFTRVNAQPIAQTSLEVTLPRGTKELHLYVVLAVSAGQVESVWPGAADGALLRKRPIAFAAPQIAVPSPPDLEVARVLDTSTTPPRFRAQLRVRTKPGARVSRVDLHRVRVPDAALALDTMGPPIARLVGSTADYTVVPTTSSEPGVDQALGTISGRDSVEGSWKRVYYRAVAWAADAPARGLYGGRSLPSAAREVIVPPAAHPDLSNMAWRWPGGPVADVLVEATTSASVAETSLGPHRLKVDVSVEKDDGTLTSLFNHPLLPGRADALNQVPETPPPAGHQGLWRSAGASPGQTALSIRVSRSSIQDRLKVRLLLTDPLGRSTERLLDVPAGMPIVTPDILQPRVVPRPPRGFVLAFETSVPVSATPAGPYRLSVTWVRGNPLSQPPLHVDLLLPSIPTIEPGEDPFADPAPIPVRRARTIDGQTDIAVLLRGTAGTVTIVLTAPDGQVASLRRRLL